MDNKPHKALLDKSTHTKQLTYQGTLRIDPHELIKGRRVKRRYWCMSDYPSIYLEVMSYKDLCEWQEKQVVKLANNKCDELNKKLKSREYRYVRYTVNGTRKYKDKIVMEFSFTIEKPHHTKKLYRYQDEHL